MIIKKILVVDDILSQIQQIQSILEAANFQIITAQSGIDAIKMATEHLPDLIFMDIVMPKMDGFAACRELKNNTITMNIPIILVSSKDQETDKVWAQLQGAKNYITKPYTSEQIIAQIDQYQ